MLTVTRFDHLGQLGLTMAAGSATLGTLPSPTSTVSGNSAASDGGGIYNSSYRHLTVTSSTISGNLAKYGGGIYSSALQRVEQSPDRLSSAIRPPSPVAGSTTVPAS